MSVERTLLGKLLDGREAFRYTLKNKRGTEASFTDLGGIWLTMLVHDKDGGMKDVVLGCEDAEDLLKNPGHMGEPVGRNANRIGGALFVLNGKEYKLEVNSGSENNLHSGPDYWRSRIWKAAFDASGRGNSVKFSLESPDMDQGFPGNLHAAVTYSLSEDDTLSIHYEAECDQDTVVNMTNHAYFNLAGHESGDAQDQIIWINADSYTPTNVESIPMGDIQRVAMTPMDFRTPKRISQDVDSEFDQLQYADGYDHNYCLNDFDGEIRLVASAYSRKTGIKMEVYTDLEGMQFYTANSLNVMHKGKGGVSYDARCGYCFETQHYPDAVNQPAFPSSILSAGAKYDTTTSFHFFTE